MTDQPKKRGPPAGTKYGRRHDENCVPMVILKDRGGYGIAEWDEQSTEEQCDWIKKYLYEADDCCYGKEQKAKRKLKVHRWTKAHKKGELAYSSERCVQIYYEHFQLRHNLRERDLENAKLRERLDIEKKIYWDEVEAREKDMDENRELKKENERLKKQLEALQTDDSKVLVDKEDYGKLMRIHNWVKAKSGQKIKVLFNMGPECFVD